MNFVEKFGVEIIKSGPIPKHISLIMDGNRTYSKKNKINLSTGYGLGFNKAFQVLQWSLAIGIEQVSVYAFSIENFNRSEEEITVLMNAAREKIKAMIMDASLIKDGVRINCLGKLSLLPKDLFQLMMELVEKTKNGKNLTFNFMIAYTAQEEISHSMRTNVENLLKNKISFDEITEESITKSLYLAQPVDILIRSSGVTRLSDYMMWQSVTAPLCFVKNTWPDVGLVHILVAVFYYQVTHKRLMSVKKCLLGS